MLKNILLIKNTIQFSLKIQGHIYFFSKNFFSKFVRATNHGGIFKYLIINER